MTDRQTKERKGVQYPHLTWNLVLGEFLLYRIHSIPVVVLWVWAHMYYVCIDSRMQPLFVASVYIIMFCVLRELSLFCVK